MEYQERIFGLFKRLQHERRIRGNPDRAICYRILEHYPGRIRVDSTPGEGSRFYFMLLA